MSITSCSVAVPGAGSARTRRSGTPPSCSSRSASVRRGGEIVITWLMGGLVSLTPAAIHPRAHALRGHEDDSHAVWWCDSPLPSNAPDQSFHRVGILLTEIDPGHALEERRQLRGLGTAR